MVVVGMDEEIAQSPRGPRQQLNRAEDAGQPPHVLVLKIAASRPLMHPDRKHVTSGPQRRADVEFGRQPASLAVSDQVTVEPYGEARVDPVEQQQRAVCRPVIVDSELTSVLPGGVI